MRLNNFLFVVILGLAIFAIPGALSAYSNPSTNWQANQPTFQNLYSGDMGSFWPILTQMKNGQCNATSDFIIGIPPGGCSPAVVRSDLLEEQNVPVFCKLYAIKVNPLIKVSSIKSISFSGKYPSGVRSIVFHPARAAIRSYTTLIGDPTVNNIGYVVIILKQNKIEKNMSKWIAGNLTATINYQADEAFGTGAGDYYLPVMGDKKWDSNYADSSFWNGRGYLRVTSIDGNSARIQLLTSKNKIARTLNLKEGETSSVSYLPGYYCKAGLRVKLNSFTVPENKALLNVDGQTIWVRDNGKFLNGRCRVTNLKVEGNNEGTIDIYCNGAGKTISLSLKKKGAIFTIGGKGNPVEYHTGDNVGGKYLIYYGVFGSGEKSSEFVVLSNKNPSDKERKEWQSDISKNISSATNFSSLESGIKSNKELKVMINGGSESGIEFDGLANKISEKEYSKNNGEISYVEKYFNAANESVDELINLYAHEMKENGDAYGESALYSQIELAGNIGKFGTKAALMDLFINTYPSSKIIDKIRRERQMLNGADFENSITNVYVGNKFHSISVVDFKSVDEGKKAVDLRIGGILHNNLTEKGKPVKLAGAGNITIQDILPGKVMIHFYSDKQGVDSKTVPVFLGDSVSLGGTNVYVKDIRVNEVAHVSLIPEVDHTTTKANFTFKIGIEKSAIQLSPEKTKEMLKNINATIVQWQNIVDRLGKVIKGLKGACFVTSAVLTIENMVSGMNGASMSRQRVMKKYRGICDTKYREMSHTECYNNLAGNISREVSKTTAAYNAVNKIMEKARANNVGDSGGLFGGKSVVDNNKYKASLQEKVGKNKEISVDIGGGQIIEVPVSKIDSVSQLREVLLCEQLGCDKISKKERDKVLRNTALSIQQSNERDAVANSLANEGVNGIDASDIVMYSNQKTVNSRWTGKKGEDFVGLNGEDANKRMQVVVSPNGAKFYLVVLSTPASGGAMGPQKVYERNDNQWTSASRPDWTNNMAFYPSGSGECSNAFKDGTASVSYYEYGNNKGLPAIVPFDLNNGWYAMVPNSAGTFLDNSPQGYTASADANYFKICNIGENHLMQSGKVDDLCQTFDVNTAASVNKFISCPKESPQEVANLYRKAREAIREASAQHGQKSINIFNQVMDVGKPMSQLNGFECQDFMSPGDCKLMFNVCDPVICPPSRCDLGGRMHVSNVIQTGVIGSLALCLPNFKDGIIIPICLSGVHAGIDAYLSILKSESSCLQQSLKTGEHVGVCKEITSIYMCEFFWRQLSPVMDQLLPSLVASMVSPGQRVRGGGEYALVQNAWSTMHKSVSYFKDFYAKNAFKAFNLRSTQQIGGTFCHKFVGTSVPSSANVLNSLLKPESPPQFYAQFSETLFTEATAPSTSQYNVYFHIYAGKDEGVQYRVYLKNPPASSYYDSNPTVPVKVGYIAKGASADKTVDFTAPSGYKELCVVINAKEECGFKQVTTNFAMNYIKDKFTEEQVNKSNITTEKECISGSPSVLSMANLNVQAGAEEVAKPNIALRGIVRICASNNPAASVNNRDFRWKDVGYCGDISMRCWLDTDSVKKDLQSIEAIGGIPNMVLDENRGMIKNGNLNLKAVRGILFLAREKIKTLTPSDLKRISKLKVIENLNSIIGDDEGNGAGTNGDRAEALALKISIYRMGVIEAKKSKVVRVIGVFPPVIAEIQPNIDVENKIIPKKPNVPAVKKSLAELMKGRSDCNCGDNCDDYARYIEKYSKRYGIDNPLLVLAVMIQESNCKYDAKSGSSSFGLMQISGKSFGKICKGKLSAGYDNDFNSIKINLLRTEQNIECGVMILARKYKDYGKGVKNSWSWVTSPIQGGFSPSVRSCMQKYSQYAHYKDWDAALRGYNGWGCSTGADVGYVEDVDKIFSDLKREE